NCNGIASIEQGRRRSRHRRGSYPCQLARARDQNVQNRGHLGGHALLRVPLLILVIANMCRLRDKSPPLRPLMAENSARIAMTKHIERPRRRSVSSVFPALLAGALGLLAVTLLVVPKAA